MNDLVIKQTCKRQAFRENSLARKEDPHRDKQAP